MEGVFDWMLHLYGATLHWVLHHRPVMLAMFVAVLLVTAGPIHGRAQGLHPGYRQRQFQHQHRSRAGHLLLPDGEVSATGLLHRGAGSRYRELLFVHRRQLLRTLRRLRPHDGQHQAAAAAQRLGGRDGQPPASQALQHPRPARFALGATGHPRGRTHVQERLRFHAVRSGHPATLRRSAQTGARRSPACPACRTSSAICRSRRRASISCSTATAPPPCT